MFLPMKLESVYHMCIPLILDSLPHNMRFLPLEAEMDPEAMALRYE